MFAQTSGRARARKARGAETWGRLWGSRMFCVQKKDMLFVILSSPQGHQGAVRYHRQLERMDAANGVHRVRGGCPCPARVLNAVLRQECAGWGWPLQCTAHAWRPVRGLARTSRNEIGRGKRRTQGCRFTREFFSAFTESVHERRAGYSPTPMPWHTGRGVAVGVVKMRMLFRVD